MSWWTVHDMHKEPQAEHVCRLLTTSHAHNRQLFLAPDAAFLLMRCCTCCPLLNPSVPRTLLCCHCCSTHSTINAYHTGGQSETASPGLSCCQGTVLH